MSVRSHKRSMMKIRSKNNLYPYRYFTEHIVSAFGELPQESDSNHKPRAFKSVAKTRPGNTCTLSKSEKLQLVDTTSGIEQPIQFGSPALGTGPVQEATARIEHRMRSMKGPGSAKGNPSRRPAARRRGLWREHDGRVENGTHAQDRVEHFHGQRQGNTEQ
jgi:hypothetical protein